MIAWPTALAILAAFLFGAATPASKWLLSSLTPFQLAGLLYLGAALGAGPAALPRGRIRLPGRTDRRNRLRLFGAVVLGGVVGPVLLLLGLRLAAAASVSLWLNFEVAATALIGVLIFHDHLGRAGWAGVAAALAGAVLLSLGGGSAGLAAGALVVLACVCWGFDNHLTALIDGITPAESTFWKGLIAGGTNLAIGLALDPLGGGAGSGGGGGGAVAVLAALFVGIWSYGASIVLYISSAQALGATRAQVAFATAPFFGVTLSGLVLGESLGLVHVISGLFFVAGIGLLTAERHAHAHEHQALEHEHTHRHDDGHHAHEHAGREAAAVGSHLHRHRHEAVVHVHPHWPDLHHRHGHGGGGG